MDDRSRVKVQRMFLFIIWSGILAGTNAALGKGKNQLNCSDWVGYMFVSPTTWSGYEHIPVGCLNANILFVTSKDEATYRTATGGEYLKYSCKDSIGHMKDYYPTKGKPPVYDGKFEIVSRGVIWQGETLILMDPERESGKCPKLPSGEYEGAGKTIKVNPGKVPLFYHENVIEDLKYLCFNGQPYFTQGIIPTIPSKLPLCGKVEFTGDSGFIWLGQKYKD